MPPGGYLVAVENTVKFSSVYPQTANITGNFGDGAHGFKLSNNSELIQLKNASLEAIDSVRYDDELPWPPAADGTGSTLQLVSWQSDNALPQSWKANPATPGLPNQSGTQPQKIDFQPIADKIFTAPPFAIYATASSGLPVTFNIISGPAMVNGDIVTLTGAEGIVVIKASQQGNSTWQPAQDVYQSFNVKIPAGYCNAKADRPWLEWIERVQFGDIDHLSFKTPFGNFTSVSTDAPFGETLTLTITPAFSWEVFDEYFRAWIDFNRDGDFEDAGEMVLEATSSGAVSADVLIPADASEGPARMRIAMQRGAFAGYCENFVFGEVQDYTVMLTPDNNLSDNGNLQGKSFLKLAPNPANSILSAHFTTKHSGPVKAWVVDANGVEVIKDLFQMQAGDHYIEVDVSGLPSGTYHLFLQPDKQKPVVGGFIKVE